MNGNGISLTQSPKCPKRRDHAAEEEARGYELTPEIERKVRLALSHFPAD